MNCSVLGGDIWGEEGGGGQDKLEDKTKRSNKVHGSLSTVVTKCCDQVCFIIEINHKSQKIYTTTNADPVFYRYGVLILSAIRRHGYIIAVIARPRLII